jgi:hypothetical protein
MWCAQVNQTHVPSEDIAFTIRMTVAQFAVHQAAARGQNEDPSQLVLRLFDGTGALLDLGVRSRSYSPASLAQRSALSPLLLRCDRRPTSRWSWCRFLTPPAGQWVS